MRSRYKLLPTPSRPRKQHLQHLPRHQPRSNILGDRFRVEQWRELREGSQFEQQQDDSPCDSADFQRQAAATAPSFISPGAQRIHGFPLFVVSRLLCHSKQETL